MTYRVQEEIDRCGILSLTSTAEQTDITDTRIEIDRCEYCDRQLKWSRQTRQTHRHSCRQTVRRRYRYDIKR